MQLLHRVVRPLPERFRYHGGAPGQDKAIWGGGAVLVFQRRLVSPVGEVPGAVGRDVEGGCDAAGVDVSYLAGYVGAPEGVGAAVVV